MPTPLPVIADTFRVAFNWLQGPTGQTAVNVMHFHGTGGAETSADLFEALQDAITTNQWTAVVNNASVDHLDITPLDGVTGTSTFSTGSGAQWTGSSAGQFVPAAAMIVKLQTGLRGRANRGRIFLPFISENGIANGFNDPTNIAVCLAAFNAMQASLAGDAGPGGPWAQGVASYDRRHGGAGAHINPVLAYQVESASGTQRRRQGRLR